MTLLAEVDRAMGTLSGTAKACVLRRQRDVFGDTRFERLGSISGAPVQPAQERHLSRPCVVQTKTPFDEGGDDRHAPCTAPPGGPVSSASTASIKAISMAPSACTTSTLDCVTQWEVTARAQTISDADLLPVIEQMLDQFPFAILGVHADSGSE
ncbi:hypothetical protein HHL24_41405 [Paraburkholderia sp. RP-4-7]|uniref:Uncharacterized protein n=1 Tax=Paraburkholderia polaris TaxID=2728848 RepID=A0A848IWR6_9BURK|nr:hypothetical protein [Paraburkholderia polaris]NMM04294.1 hypothetical protein [Paraburkholderia polaris]